jgi:hypothetical protein
MPGHQHKNEHLLNDTMLDTTLNQSILQSLAAHHGQRQSRKLSQGCMEE